MDATPPDAQPPAMPRWVKVFATVAAALVLLFLLVHAAGGGLGGH